MKKLLIIVMLLSLIGCGPTSEQKRVERVKNNIAEIFTTYQVAASTGNKDVACAYARRMIFDAVTTNDASYASQYQQYVVSSCGA